MQTCLHALKQHFSKPEQSSSPCQASTQMPIWSGLGLGQNSGFLSAAGNFNIIFMLIFCYSVLAERFSTLSSSSSTLLLSLSLIVKVHTQWFRANMPTSIRATFIGTFTIAIPRAGLHTSANLTGSGLGTQTRFYLCCKIIKNSPFPHFHNEPCLPPKMLHKNCFRFL